MSNAKVLFDYDAEADDELTLKEGDLITSIEKKEDGWWEGELYGRRGMFPENFVEEIKKQIPSSSKQITEEKPVVSSEKSTFAKVTFEYEAENDDELTLKVGETVKVLDQEEEGWWKGELNGKIGVFPTNFVEVMNETAQPSFSLPKQEQSEEKTPEKKTPKSMGGMGFGGILTQDALSGIKLRTTSSNSKLPPKKEKPAEEPTELSKRLSLKSRTPETSKNQPARPPKQSKIKEKAVVEYDYEGEQSDELTLKKNDIIDILEKDVSEGWWKGELNGKVGLFPENFVKLITEEEPKQETVIAKETLQPDMPLKLPPENDVPDSKPSRPEPPFPKLKPTLGHKPPLPTSKPADEIPKKPEVAAPGQDEKVAKMEKPPKKSPPLLPKKPDKPKPPVDKPQINKEPQVELRKRNGPTDPTKRFSEMPHSEVGQSHETTRKRHSSGPDIPLNLNEIKSTNVLQPLTSDRPKNPAKNLPTKYGKSNSPKSSTPEKVPVNDVDVAKPLQLDKPKKPAIPAESTKPPDSLKSKINESTISSDVIEKLQDNINTLKASLESSMNKLKEQIQTSEKKFKAMEKKMTEEIDDITKELDEEKKARSALEVEVNRLRKLIKQQMSS